MVVMAYCWTARSHGSRKALNTSGIERLDYDWGDWRRDTLTKLSAFFQIRYRCDPMLATGNRLSEARLLARRQDWSFRLVHQVILLGISNS